ncbi:MAG: helix-turn-helix domain-containing protein [Candidatus Stygibacter frigidus]|nr:helix-turn-helix domain-containing protein [Candidatus Stygibacter frigidus]
MKSLNYMTVEEVMQELDITRRTVYRYCKKGILKFSKPANKKLYIIKDSVKIFLDNGLHKYHLKSANTNEGGQTEKLRT